MTYQQVLDWLTGLFDALVGADVDDWTQEGDTIEVKLSNGTTIVLQLRMVSSNG